MNFADHTIATVAFPFVSETTGCTMFRFVIRKGKKTRTGERLADDQASFEQDMRRLIADEFTGFRLVLAYPVPMGLNFDGGILAVGGP